MDKIIQFFKDNDWKIVKSFCQKGKDAEYVDAADLGLGQRVVDFLRKKFREGLYRHQHESIRRFMHCRKNICIATPTASGKTLVFQVCAMDILDQNPDARILVVFPTRALVEEQSQRWRADVAAAGFSSDIIGTMLGGDQSGLEQLTAKIVLATPDVVHARILRRCGERNARDFLARMRLLVVDEVHNYSGAFGSNAAYMFRRLGHAIALCGGGMRIIAASATINNPEKHLSDLLGQKFDIIGEEFDSAKRFDRKIWMINPLKPKELLNQLVPFVRHLAEHAGQKSIVFVDNRQRVEQVAGLSQAKGAHEIIDAEKDMHEHADQHGYEKGVYPFRSGYERGDQREIQRALREGGLSSIISTSALELGIDIPGLPIGVCWGVPASKTSFLQRIGRVGRDTVGNIFVFNNGSPHSVSVFNDPEKLLDMPLSESSLYLENKRMQYIHVLCLADRTAGEHGKIAASQNLDDDGANELILQYDFPESFVRMCGDEITGQTDAELDGIRDESGGDPHLRFPIRTNDPQFNVEVINQDLNRGFLSESQVIREAYPGAIYRYKGTPYIVKRVDRVGRVVRVLPKGGITAPISLPAMIFPKFFADTKIRKHGDLHIMDTDVRVQNTVIGYKHGRTSVQYPSEIYSNKYFAFSKTTSGVLLHLPCFNGMDWSTLRAVAELLFESFVSKIPYDRQDVDFGADKFRVGGQGIVLNDKFVAVFDQNRGGLRLSAKLMDNEILLKCIAGAKQSAATGEFCQDNLVSVFAQLEELARHSSDKIDGENSNCIEVVCQESVGIRSNGERVVVDKIIYHPKMRDFCYVARPEISGGRNEQFVFPVGDMQDCEDTKKCLFDVENQEWVETNDQ